jgi:Heterokaryon incompatibility protein (HET)
MAAKAISSAVKIYEYLPLERARGIRLFKLRAEISDKPLSGTIEHADIDSAPPYLALSYVWGSPEKNHSVQIGDKELPITASLNSALLDIRHISNPGHNVYIWADGICINQADSAERSQQVAMMKDVYSCSTGVTTYIGPATEHSDAAIDLAYKLYKFDLARKGGTWRPHELTDETYLGRYGLPALNDPAWAALSELLDRPWPSRAWIVQESLLNKQILMLCGRRFMHWDLLSKIAFLISNFRIPNLEIFQHSKFSYLSTQSELRGFARNDEFQHDRSFYHLLRICHTLSCSDPRDRIYSLLGICPDLDKFQINVDYDKPVEELYINIAIQLVKVYGNLDIFSSVLSEKSLDLPSWVPDWSTHDLRTERLLNNPYVLKYGLKRASMDLKAELEVNPLNNQLSVKGGIVDRISHVDTYSLDHSALLTPFLREQLDRISTLLTVKLEPADLEEWKELLDGINDFDGPFPNPVFIGAMKLEAFLSGKERESIVPDFLKEVNVLIAAFHHTVEFRRFFTTDQGYIGLGPMGIKPGDNACVLLGGKIPYVLREKGTNFELLGECYLHGVMKGEALQMENFVQQMFTLV